MSSYPPGYALKTLGDIKKHRAVGKWGQRASTPDAFAIAAIEMLEPISLVNFQNSVIESGKDFWKDPRFLSGVLGRHVYGEKESTQPKKWHAR